MHIMALRQLLRVTCLALSLLISSVGAYGPSDLSGELQIRPQNPYWNSTGSAVSAAAKSFRLSTPSSEGILAPQTTPTSEQPIQKVSAVVLERPRPLQAIRPLHVSLSGDQTVLSVNTLLSSTKATFTPTRASSLPSSDEFVYHLGASRGSSTASRSRSVSASALAPTDGLRVVRPSDAATGRVLASGRNQSSTLTLSSPCPTANLTPASSVIRTTGSGSTIGSSNNASASHRSIAATSGTGESPRLAKFLEPIENRTESRTIIRPWLGPRPLDVRPVHFLLSSPRIGLYATPGALIQKSPLATATGSDRTSSTQINLAPMGTGETSALRNSLESMKNRTESRKSERLKAHRPSVGLSLSGFNASAFNRTGHYLGVITGGQYPTNCSGLVTSTAHLVYEVVTSTVLVNETMTLGPNATTPLPVFITPPPACQTISAPCEGTYCPSSTTVPINRPNNPKEPESPINVTPYTPVTSTSTLLVTKKTPVIVQQPSTVGNLFGPSTPTSQAAAAQPNSDGQQAAGQSSASSSPEMTTQSDDSSASDSDSDGQFPDKSTTQQNPTDGNSASTSSNSQNSASQNPGAASSGSQSTGSDDQTTSDGDQPNGAASNSGATSNHGDTSGIGEASGSRDASGNGDASSNGGTSNSGSTNTGSGTSSNGRVTNNGGASNHEVSSSNVGTSNSGSTNAGGGASSNGDSSSSDGTASDVGDDPSNESASSNGQVSSNNGVTEPGAGDSADSHARQYVPSVIMAGTVPISIASNAVIVGSDTVNAGSPPTTLVANGQTIAIQPSQIVAQGKTIPIQAAVTPPPANSATIGNVPVVLRPHDVAIGSKTFEHGSSPTSVIYNGQTYSWDASHLAVAGATVAFPSPDSSAPLVTAGGQVFSVFPSQLKASGRNIPLPSTAKASPFVYNGQTFLVNPSQIIAPDTSITLPPANKVTAFVYIDHSLSVDASQFMARSTTISLSSGSGIVTYNGQVLTIKPSEIIGPSTTIALSAPDDNAASPTAVTTGGLTFSIGPSAAVVGSSTYSFVPGKAPATIMTNGEAVLVGSNGVQFGNVHVPIPTGTPSFSAITQGDLTFSVAPSEVVVGGHTDKIYFDMTPITKIVDGHTISIGPKGVGLASTTIPLPTPKPSFSMATEGDLTFSIAPSEVVVNGKTYCIPSNKAPITTAIDGQIMTIGPKGIRLDGTTVNLPVIQTPIDVTAGGFTFLVGATNAVISGTTYAIGSGAPLQTVMVGSQTVEVGSAGIMLPSTTIAPEQTPTAITADGLTFSADSTEAIINGTTYAIGSGAAAKTIVEGSTTIVLGTDGVALPSTTIRPWSSASQIRFSSILGTSGASSAATVIGPLTPIATGKEGDKKHAAGVSTRVPDYSTLLAFVLGVLAVDLTLI